MHMTTQADQNEGTFTPERRLSAAVRLARWCELITIFFFLPAFVALLTDPSQRVRPLFEDAGAADLYDTGRGVVRFIFPILITMGILAGAWLSVDPTFDTRRLWNRQGFKGDAKRILGWFVLGALTMLGAAWLLSEYTDIMTITRGDQTVSAFLRLPREAPIVLVLIAIGYPWLSCYPQEILHRAFYFHRYAPIMGTPALILTNTLAFAWLHAAFWSLEALLLTLPGGLLFAYTYHRTRSTLAVTIEHALYGWWAFFTGLGWFVFTGSIGS